MTRTLSIEYSPPLTDAIDGLDRPKIDRSDTIQTIRNHSRRLVASTVAVFRSPKQTLSDADVDNWLSYNSFALEHYRQQNEKHDDYTHEKYATLRDFDQTLRNIQFHKAAPRIKSKLYNRASAIIHQYYLDRQRTHQDTTD